LASKAQASSCIAPQKKFLRGSRGITPLDCLSCIPGTKAHSTETKKQTPPMKLSIQLLFAAALLLLAASCKKVNADGPTVTELRHHTGFTSVSSSVNATVIVSQAPDFRVEIHAQQALLDRMKTKVEGGELRFYYPGNVNIGRHDGVTIYISAPELDGFTINGSGELRGGELRATDKTVRLEINGSGSMFLPKLSSGAIEAKVVGSGSM